MITFSLNRMQQSVKQEFAFFARESLRPFAAEADRIADIPRGLLQSPGALRYARALIPRQFGGGYRSLVDGADRCDLADNAMMRVIMCEEIGYGDTPLFVALPGPGLAEPALRAFGTAGQQLKFFGIFDDPTPRWAAFAMTEPGAGSDAAALSTTAIKRGDRYVINGRKWFVGNGARADWAVVFATVNPEQGQFGVRAFVVERESPGFGVGRVLPAMGMKALQVAELIFKDCEVSEDNMLGGRGPRRSNGFQAGKRTFHLMRPGVAAMAVGMGRAAVEQLEQEMDRNGAGHILARKWREMGRRVRAMKRRLEAARLLCWKAACLYDHGRDNSREASMAKLLSARVAMGVCTESLELAEAAGMDDSGRTVLERLFRNAKAFDIVEGTGDVQRLTVIGSLLRRSSDGPDR